MAVDPVSGALLFSTFLGTITGLQGAKAERDQAARNAAMEQEFAEQEAIRMTEDVTRLRDLQVSKYWKAGVNPYAGSALAVLNETMQRGLEDARLVKERGIKEASVMSETGRLRQQASQLGILAGTIDGVNRAYDAGESRRMNNTGIGNTEDAGQYSRKAPSNAGVIPRDYMFNR